jgi:hypothetical protein
VDDDDSLCRSFGGPRREADSKNGLGVPQARAEFEEKTQAAESRYATWMEETMNR